MDFLHGTSFENPDFPFAHFYDGLQDPIQNIPYPIRDRTWPSSVDYHTFGCTNHNRQDQGPSASYYGRLRHTFSYDAWPQQAYTTLDGDPMFSGGLPDYTAPGELPRDEATSTRHYQFEPVPGHGRRGQRDHPRSRSHPFPSGWARFGHRRQDRDPRFSAHFNFVHGHTNDNNERHRASGQQNATWPDYTVEEPDDNEPVNSTQLPHQARRREPNLHRSEHPHESSNWTFFTLGEPERRSSADCWTLPSSVPSSPSSPHTNVPPPSPLDSPFHNPQPFTDSREDSPSSTPSRRPSSPRSPRQQDFPAYANNQPEIVLDQAALSQVYYKLHHLNRQLKQRRNKLRRLNSELIRRAENLRIRETMLSERVARENYQAGRDSPFGCYNQPR